TSTRQKRLVTPLPTLPSHGAGIIVAVLRSPRNLRIRRKRRHPDTAYADASFASLGRREGSRASEITPAMTAKLPMRTITSRLAANKCCASAWRVLWPEPVRTASRHASSEDAAATPTLMPQERITFRSPPASPVRDAGAAATTALLLGE